MKYTKSLLVFILFYWLSLSPFLLFAESTDHSVSQARQLTILAGKTTHQQPSAEMFHHSFSASDTSGSFFNLSSRLIFKKPGDPLQKNEITSETALSDHEGEILQPVDRKECDYCEKLNWNRNNIYNSTHFDNLRWLEIYLASNRVTSLSSSFFR